MEQNNLGRECEILQSCKFVIVCEWRDLQGQVFKMPSIIQGEGGQAKFAQNMCLNFTNKHWLGAQLSYWHFLKL